MFKSEYNTRVLTATKKPNLPLFSEKTCGLLGGTKPARAKQAELEISEFYSGKEAPKKVMQDFAVLAKKTVPLYTSGLVTCVALISVEKEEKGRHLLNHISDDYGTKKAVGLAKRKIGTDCSVYIRPGNTRRWLFSEPDFGIFASKLENYRDGRGNALAFSQEDMDRIRDLKDGGKIDLVSKSDGIYWRYFAEKNYSIILYDQVLNLLLQELGDAGFEPPTILFRGRGIMDAKLAENEIPHDYGTFWEMDGTCSICTHNGRMYEMRKNQKIAYPEGKTEICLRPSG